MNKLNLSLLLIALLSILVLNIGNVSANTFTHTTISEDEMFMPYDAHYVVLSDNNSYVSIDLDLHNVLLAKLPLVLPEGTRCIIYNVIESKGKSYFFLIDVVFANEPQTKS